MARGWNQKIPESNFSWNILSLSLSMWSHGTVNEKHWSTRELIYITSCEELYEKSVGNVLAFIRTDTQREVLENDLVLKGRDTWYEGTVELAVWLEGRHYYLCPKCITLLCFSIFLLSGTMISHFICVYALHCWSSSKICLCYDYAQKWYSNVTQYILHRLLDVSVHLTMHIRKR